jgi:hypothetical protein
MCVSVSVCECVRACECVCVCVNACVCECDAKCANDDRVCQQRSVCCLWLCHYADICSRELRTAISVKNFPTRDMTFC